MSAQPILLDNTGMNSTDNSQDSYQKERLLADIGGTNARFALLSPNGEVHKQLVLPCAEHADIVSAIKMYLSEIGNPTIEKAAMAIANPITGDRIKMTNHHWAFSIAETRDAVGFKELIFKNDFTALAMSVPMLPPADLIQIGGNTSQEKGSALAVLGPGTGLGVSGLIKAGEQWIPLEGEGGHVSVSPANERECDILKTCWKTYEHVSVERLVSGMGLQNLYQAICELDGITE
jgi:glucokinase